MSSVKSAQLGFPKRRGLVIAPDTTKAFFDARQIIDEFYASIYTSIAQRSNQSRMTCCIVIRCNHTYQHTMDPSPSSCFSYGAESHSWKVDNKSDTNMVKTTLKLCLEYSQEGKY